MTDRAFLERARVQRVAREKLLSPATAGEPVVSQPSAQEVTHVGAAAGPEAPALDTHSFSWDPSSKEWEKMASHYFKALRPDNVVRSFLEQRPQEDGKFHTLLRLWVGDAQDLKPEDGRYIFMQKDDRVKACLKIIQCKHSQEKTLKLDMLYLTSLPPVFKYLANHVTEVDLEWNDIKVWPTELNDLKNLEEVSFWSGQLTSLKGMGDFPSLKVLCLGMNKLQGLEGLGNLPKLEELDVSHNRLARIENIPPLPELKSLNIKVNQFEMEEDALGFLDSNGSPALNPGTQRYRDLVVESEIWRSEAANKLHIRQQIEWMRIQKVRLRTLRMALAEGYAEIDPKTRLPRELERKVPPPSIESRVEQASVDPGKSSSAAEAAARGAIDVSAPNEDAVRGNRTTAITDQVRLDAKPPGICCVIM